MENSSTSTTLTTQSVSSSQTVTANHEVKTRDTTSNRVQPSITSTGSEPQATTMNTVSNESRTSTRSSLDTNTNTHNAPKLWHRSAAASAGAVLVSLFTTPLDVVRVRIQSSASKDLDHGHNMTDESHSNSKEPFKSQSSPALSVRRSDTLLHDHKVRVSRNIDHITLQHVSEIPKRLEISYGHDKMDNCKGNDGSHWNKTRVIPRSRWWYTFESYVPQFWSLQRHLEVPMTSICHNCPGKLHTPFGLDDLPKHSNTKTKNAPFSRFWRNVVGICRCVDATNRTSNALSSYSSSRMVAERFRSMQKAIKMRAAYTVPIDSIQQETSKHLNSDLNAMKDSVASRMRMSSLSVLREIVRAEGISTLWSGLSPSLIMAIPSTTLYFIAYDELKLWLESLLPSRANSVTNLQQDSTTMISSEHPLHPYVPLVAGSVARTIAATVISPLELIRTRMQSGQSKFGVIESLRNEVLRSRGISSLWRGLIPTLYRDVPFSGIYWFGYERVKHHLRPFIVEKKAYSWSCNQDHTLATAPSAFFDSWILSFISGSIAGSFAALITTPFDVVKTYRQANLLEHTQLSTGKHATVETRTIPILRSIIRRRGWPGMFAGVGPRLAKVAPACAIMVSSYELGKMLFMHSPAAAEQ